jgi:hypothetical protein
MITFQCTDTEFSLYKGGKRSRLCWPWELLDWTFWKLMMHVNEVWETQYVPCRNDAVSSLEAVVIIYSVSFWFIWYNLECQSWAFTFWKVRHIKLQFTHTNGIHFWQISTTMWLLPCSRHRTLFLYHPKNVPLCPLPGYPYEIILPFTNIRESYISFWV